MSTVVKPKAREDHSIRWMVRADLPVVLELDQNYSRTPWSMERWIHHLRRTKCVGMVIERIIPSPEDPSSCEMEIVGATLYELHKKHLNIIRLPCQDLDALEVMLAKFHTKLHRNHRERLLFNVGDHYEIVPDLLYLGGVYLYDEVGGSITVMWTAD